MSQLTHFSRPIIRHLPSLNLVVRFDDSGISVRVFAGTANGKALRGLNLHRWRMTPNLWSRFVKLTMDCES